MTEIEEKIIQGVIAVFSQYGIRKATMGDFSKMAGVSRQTIYSYFPNKDAALVGAMTYLVNKTVIAVKSAWQSDKTLDDKIALYFDIAIVQHFEQVSEMPDSSDLLGRMDKLVEGEGGLNPKLALLHELFEPYDAALKVKGSSAEELAEFIFFASSSFLFSAKDEAHLRQLLSALKHYVALLIVGK